MVGLIPSPELEERRKAYVPPEADFVHKISICGARVSIFIPFYRHSWFRNSSHRNDSLFKHCVANIAVLMNNSI